MSNTTRCTRVPHIMMPKEGTDLSRWSVVACDQYTSQPEYWAETEKNVGDAPSTLRLTLPEVYLEEEGVETRVSAIHETMTQYIQDGILQTLPAGMILTERFSGGTVPRRGLMLSVDLEAYEYRVGSQSLIRPTEKTVVERIPPRLKVRQGASLELPHIMLLIDDPTRTIIEPLFAQTNAFQKVYDTDLMQKGGHISGWFIPQGVDTDAIEEKLAALCDRAIFNQKYDLKEDLALLPFAVGDGNHSMATAKAYWEETKKTLSDAEMENHPARFALVEVVNIHDESLIIEPIHRVMFHVDAEHMLSAADAFYTSHGCKTAILAEGTSAPTAAHVFPFCTAQGKRTLVVENPQWSIPLATLQTFLDAYMSQNSDAKIDYIHGEDVVEQLGTKPENMGFFLPDIAKNDLFRGVILDGVLPRKTFSMGEAHEKRYYMEAKKITV